MTNKELDFIQRRCIHSRINKGYVLYTPPEPEKHDSYVIYRCLDCYQEWRSQKENPDLEKRIIKHD